MGLKAIYFSKKSPK